MRAGPRHPISLRRSWVLIKVVLAIEPPFLKNMLLDLLKPERDIAVVDGSAAPPAAREPLAAGDADVIVVACEGTDPDPEPLRVLYGSPRSRVLGLTSGSAHGFLYELRPHRTSLGELSRDGLLAAIRRGADPSDG